MRLRLLIILCIVILIAGCGGGSDVASGGGSGIGGTGISLVRGNVASVDGETSGAAFSSVTVNSGDASSAVDGNGNFELAIGADNPLQRSSQQRARSVLLTFGVGTGGSASLDIGTLDPGTNATVSNIRIDTSSGRASAERIDKQEPAAADNVVAAGTAGNGSQNNGNGNGNNQGNCSGNSGNSNGNGNGNNCNGNGIGVGIGAGGVGIGAGNGNGVGIGLGLGGDDDDDD